MKKTSYLKNGLIVAGVVVVLAVLGFYVVPNVIGGSSADPVPVDSLNIGNPIKDSDPVVKTSDLKAPSKDDPRLSDLFASLPEEYCDKAVKENVLIYDQENFYVKVGDDLTKGGPSYDYCEFTVFKNLTGGDDIYAISKATVTPMLTFSGLDFLNKNGDEWVKVTDDVMALVDMEKLKANGAASIAAKRPDLATEGLEENYSIELPRYGATLKFKQYNTGDTIYELKWNGTKFTAGESVTIDTDSVTKGGFAKYCSGNIKVCFSISENLNVFEHDNSMSLVITDVENEADLELGDAGMMYPTIGIALIEDMDAVKEELADGYFYEMKVLWKAGSVTIGDNEFYKVVLRGLGSSYYDNYFTENEGKVYDFKAGVDGEQAMVDLLETLEFTD